MWLMGTVEQLLLMACLEMERPPKHAVFFDFSADGVDVAHDNDMLVRSPYGHISEPSIDRPLYLTSSGTPIPASVAFLIPVCLGVPVVRLRRWTGCTTRSSR